jgi:hypothetical protein
MSKYILFGGQQYYAKGGVNDFIQFGDTVEELEYEFELLKQKAPYHYQWFQIVDKFLNIISESKEKPHSY